MVTYYKNQISLAHALIDIIDKYWAEELSEEAIISSLSELIEKNKEKLFQDDDYTSIIKQRLGKKRLDLLTKVNQHTMGDV